jgi:hypothetical protein
VLALRQKRGCAAARRRAVAPSRGSWVRPLRGLAACSGTLWRRRGCYQCCSRWLGDPRVAGTGAPPWPSRGGCGRPGPAPVGRSARRKEGGRGLPGDIKQVELQSGELKNLATGQAYGAVVRALGLWPRTEERGGEEEGAGGPTCRRKSRERGGG